MKVKNLFISYIGKNDVDKLVILRKPSKIERVIKNLPEDVYFSIFTKTGYYFNKSDISPLEIFLSYKTTKEDITYNQLKIFYENNNQKILKKIVNRPKEIPGFKEKSSEN